MGRKRSVLQTIQEETATNIYLPSPLQGLVGLDVLASPNAIARNTGAIWITGEFFGVQRARDMLYQLSATKVSAPERLLPKSYSSPSIQSKTIISRDTAILPRKLDWMVTDRAEDLKGIMNDNSTFIQFPPLGSSTSLITVFGDNRVNIQRTIRSIMQLVRGPCLSHADIDINYPYYRPATITLDRSGYSLFSSMHCCLRLTSMSAKYRHSSSKSLSLLVQKWSLKACALSFMV